MDPSLTFEWRTKSEVAKPRAKLFFTSFPLLVSYAAWEKGSIVGVKMEHSQIHLQASIQIQIDALKKTCNPANHPAWPTTAEVFTRGPPRFRS